MRLRRIAFLLAGLLVLATAPATAKGPTRHLSFTTGNFAVTCTSSGQVCSPPESLSFKLQRSGTLTSITYSTAATHCSAVLVRVLLRNHQVATTGRLPSGKATERVSTHIALKKGKTTLGFQAQGFVGGCNVGRVLSWGGKVTVTVTLP